MASTDTGSVADIKLPKAKASYQVNFYDSPISPNAHTMKLVEKTAIKVPKNEYIRMEPAFFMKYFLFMLYPDSNMIGGSSKMTKMPLKCDVNDYK
jgi:hypothetical protein